MPRVRDEQDVFEVPLTPLIDVVFLLLIFFLVATNFTRKEIDQKVNLPQSEGGVEQAAVPQDLIINIRKSGVLVVNGRVVENDDLRPIVEQFHQAHPDRPVSIRGDGDVSYQRIMTVMGLCRAVGVERVDLPVDPLSTEGGAP